MYHHQQKTTAIGQIANPHSKNLLQTGKGLVLQKDQIMKDMTEKVRLLAEVIPLLDI